jgi:N-hydroxyarylamine O-acetyltransferase
MLTAYLARLGNPQLSGPTLATLTALHRAHVDAIPFETLDVLAGHVPSLALDDVAAKLIGAGRGGYCFEHNTLFQAVLEQLGFAVTILMARVRFGGVGVRPRTHALLRVEAEGRPYLMDVGFGGWGLAAPLRLDAGVQRHDGLLSHRLMKTGDLWVLQAWLDAAWTDLHAFTLEPCHAVDYEMTNHYTASHRDSPFVNLLAAQRIQPRRRLVLRGRELAVLTAAGLETRVLASAGEARAVLAGDFGIRLPADMRLPDGLFA